MIVEEAESNLSQGRLPQMKIDFQLVPTSRGARVELLNSGAHQVQRRPSEPITFAHLQYRQVERPQSARENYSYGSFMGGAVHLRHTGLKVHPNKGDQPGMGKNYNPMRKRDRQRNRSQGSTNNNEVGAGGGVADVRSDRASQRSQLSQHNRVVEVNIVNVEKSGKIIGHRPDSSHFMHQSQQMLLPESSPIFEMAANESHDVSDTHANLSSPDKSQTLDFKYANAGGSATKKKRDSLNQLWCQEQQQKGIQSQALNINELSVQEAGGGDTRPHKLSSREGLEEDDIVLNAAVFRELATNPSAKNNTIKMCTCLGQSNTDGCLQTAAQLTPSNAQDRQNSKHFGQQKEQLLGGYPTKTVPNNDHAQCPLHAHSSLSPSTRDLLGVQNRLKRPDSIEDKTSSDFIASGTSKSVPPGYNQLVHFNGQKENSGVWLGSKEDKTHLPALQSPSAFTAAVVGLGSGSNLNQYNLPTPAFQSHKSPSEAQQYQEAAAVAGQGARQSSQTNGGDEMAMYYEPMVGHEQANNSTRQSLDSFSTNQAKIAGFQLLKDANKSQQQFAKDRENNKNMQDQASQIENSQNQSENDQNNTEQMSISTGTKAPIGASGQQIISLAKMQKNKSNPAQKSQGQSLEKDLAKEVVPYQVNHTLQDSEAQENGPQTTKNSRIEPLRLDIKEKLQARQTPPPIGINQASLESATMWNATAERQAEMTGLNLLGVASNQNPHQPNYNNNIHSSSINQEQQQAQQQQYWMTQLDLLNKQGGPDSMDYIISPPSGNQGNGLSIDIRSSVVQSQTGQEDNDNISGFLGTTVSNLSKLSGTKGKKKKVLKKKKGVASISTPKSSISLAKRPSTIKMKVPLNIKPKVGQKSMSPRVALAGQGLLPSSRGEKMVLKSNASLFDEMGKQIKKKVKVVRKTQTSNSSPNNRSIDAKRSPNQSSKKVTPTPSAMIDLDLGKIITPIKQIQENSKSERKEGGSQMNTSSGGGCVDTQKLTDKMLTQQFTNENIATDGSQNLMQEIAVSRETSKIDYLQNRAQKVDRSRFNQSRNSTVSQCSADSKKSNKSSRNSKKLILKALETPSIYNTQGDEIIQYTLGSKAKFIETPLFQQDTQHKLMYSLKLDNGDAPEDPPSFFRLVQEKATGRCQIMVKSRTTLGETRLYRMILKVHNPEQNSSGMWRFRVFVQAGSDLFLLKSFFESPVEFQIGGPSLDLLIPLYSASHEELDFYLSSCGENQHSAYQSDEVPKFAQIGRDEVLGKRIIRLKGTDLSEIGEHSIKLIAHFSSSNKTNGEFTFKVLATKAPEDLSQINESGDEEPLQNLIQFAIPQTLLETVKEVQDQEPLEYSLEMRNGESVPKFIVISTLPTGEKVVELKADELPPGVKKSFEVNLLVYDPNGDTTQTIPISVKCPAPELSLIVQKNNFTKEIVYKLRGREKFVQVPDFARIDGKQISSDILLTLGGSNTAKINRIASIYTHPHGNQYIKIFSQEDDLSLLGDYQVRIFATDQESGLTNHEITFKLKIERSALTRLCSPTRAFKGQPVMYEANEKSISIPLPRYNEPDNSNRKSGEGIRYELQTEDGQSAPDFVQIIGDQVVIKGCKNRGLKSHKLRLVVTDLNSECQDILPLTIGESKYEIKLAKWDIQNSIDFVLGEEMIVDLPQYSQTPFEGHLLYRLESKGIGMVAAGVNLVSLIQQSDDENKWQIKIAGGKNSNKGTYQITVIAYEETQNETNSEAVFFINAKPKLRLVERPAEFDNIPELQANKTYHISVPTYETKNKLRYIVQDKDGDSTDLDFIQVKCPKNQKPFLQVNHTGKPAKEIYNLELISSDYRQHVEDVQPFKITFDTTPALKLENFKVDRPLIYTLKSGPISIDPPKYVGYLVDLTKVKLSFVSKYTQQVAQFCSFDRKTNKIVIESDDLAMEGKHDLIVFAYYVDEDLKKAVDNQQANLRIELIDQPNNHEQPQKFSKLPTTQLRNDQTGSLQQNLQTFSPPSETVTSYKPDVGAVNTIGVGIEGEDVSQIPRPDDTEEEDEVIQFNSDNESNGPITPTKRNHHSLKAKKETQQEYQSKKGKHQSSKEAQNEPEGDGRFNELIEGQKEIRRQIAEVKADLINRSRLELSIDRNQGKQQMQQQSFQQEQVSPRVPREELNNPTPSELENFFTNQTSINQALNVQAAQQALNEEIIVQDEAFYNQLLRQRIEMGRQRHLNQVKELDRIRQEVQQASQVTNQHENLAKQLQIASQVQNQPSNAAKAKKGQDSRLKALRDQLAQLQEESSHYRQETAQLKQREDELKSEVALKEQKVKSIVERNTRESTLITSMFTEVDKFTARNANLKEEIQLLESELEQGKSEAQKVNSNLKEFKALQSSIDDQMNDRIRYCARLKVDLEAMKRRERQSRANPAIPQLNLPNQESQDTAHLDMQKTFQCGPQSARNPQTVSFGALAPNQSSPQQQPIGTASYNQHANTVSQHFQQQQYDQNYASSPATALQQQQMPSSNHFQLQSLQSASNTDHLNVSRFPQVSPMSYKKYEYEYEQQLGAVDDMPPAGKPTTSIDRNQFSKLYQQPPQSSTSTPPQTQTQTQTPPNIKSSLRQPNHLPSHSQQFDSRAITNATMTPGQFQQYEQQPLMQQNFAAAGMRTPPQNHPSQFLPTSQQQMTNINNYPAPNANVVWSGNSHSERSHHQSPNTSSSIVNPPPQKSYKPQDNGIFGENRTFYHTTTYTQAANREKFRGDKFGEMGGERKGGLVGGKPQLEIYQRQTSNLYPGVAQGSQAGVTSSHLDQNWFSQQFQHAQQQSTINANQSYQQ